MGHINIIIKSRELGRLLIGLLTDEAVESYKRKPICSFLQRKTVAENIKGVWKVVPQHTLDYTENLRKYKPNIVTNGDDMSRNLPETVEQLKRILDEWNGKYIEIPYTDGVSSTMIIKRMK